MSAPHCPFPRFSLQIGDDTSASMSNRHGSVCAPELYPGTDYSRVYLATVLCVRISVRVYVRERGSLCVCGLWYVVCVLGR